MRIAFLVFLWVQAILGLVASGMAAQDQHWGTALFQFFTAVILILGLLFVGVGP